MDETAAGDEFERLRRDFGWRIEERMRQVDGVWSGGQAHTLSYPEQDRAELARIEERSYWFLHRNRIIWRLLERQGGTRTLWEIGSGNGFVAWSLQQAGLEVVAVEPGMEGARNAAQRGVRRSIASTLEELCLPDACLPALGCFDVLEHLESPASFLHECFRVLEPGGRVAVTVPASPALWSQADEDAGHFRRYTRRTLDAAMARAGFKRIQSGYMMMVLWLPLFALRALPYRLGRKRTKDENRRIAIAQLAPRPGPASALISTALALESAIGRWVPLPIGTSAAGLYYKAADPAPLGSA